LTNRRRHPRRLRLSLIALAAVALLAAWQGGIAPAGAAAKEVRFGGETVQVPRSWPVYRLARHPGMCARLDRRAVYLGTPAANQRCAADAVGGRRAILVDPRSERGRAGATGSALARPALPRASASAGGSVYTGLGFDACSAPSSKAMAAWADSPYRAVGVYIGGVNRACSQPNLTASWVGAQTAAGWHLIPTYVGRQAPTSACGSCATLSLNTTTATAQGAAEAIDAVEQASAVAMGPGSPIYFDMEAYSPGSSASAATLAFLEGWTDKLHALGYLSGVYSSSGSGIADLAAQVGSDYSQPDGLWIANWNGQQNTSDPVAPANAWAAHQRIHQYRGGHDESYGGVTINLDNNYVDGPTVGSATLPTGADDPVGYLDLSGSPQPGHVRVKGWAFDPNSPTAPLGIRVYVGGRAETAGAVEYELGPATSSRADVGAKYPEAGRPHGFDATFPTVKSGPQPVCVYAIGIAPGADRLLGCRATGIGVAIVLTHLKATARGVQVRIACEWPTGTACPGQLALRTRFKVAVRRGHGRRPQIRVVTRSLGRRAFKLTGSRARAFVIPLSAGGRQLLRQRGRLRTQLIAAIPGGRRSYTLGIE
jgi:hypothetical protein